MQDVFYDDAGSDDSPGGIGQRFAQILGWAGAALSLLLVASIIIWAYRLGVRDARDIPVIRALDIPARVQPADPGGTVEPHQGLEVNEILAGSEAQTPADSTLAPVEPALAEEDQPIPVGETQIAALARQAVEAQPVAATAVDEDLPVIDEGEAQAEQILQQIARLPSSDMRPRARPSDLRRTSESSGIAVAVEASATEVVPGTRVVQLGAFDSENQATTHWRALVGDHSDLLALKKQYIQRADSNGRVFYRLRVVGFDDANDQRSMCEALRARSVDCIPVTVR